MKTGTYEYKSDFARRYYGQGETQALLLFLAARGISVSDEARERIERCTDLEQLAEWIRRAAVVDSAEELFR